VQAPVGAHPTILFRSAAPDFYDLLRQLSAATASSLPSRAREPVVTMRRTRANARFWRRFPSDGQLGIHVTGSPTQATETGGSLARSIVIDARHRARELIVVPFVIPKPSSWSGEPRTYAGCVSPPGARYAPPKPATSPASRWL